MITKIGSFSIEKLNSVNFLLEGRPLVLENYEVLAGFSHFLPPSVEQVDHFLFLATLLVEFLELCEVPLLKGPRNLLVFGLLVFYLLLLLLRLLFQLLEVLDFFLVAHG